MYQSWGKLLFIHWEMPPHVLHGAIPPGLALDTFEGKAWLSLTPFTIWGTRLIGTPPFPWLSSFHEINVRTYVHVGGVPGVWFFSLDASSRLAVKAARTFYHLPYYKADMTLDQTQELINYHSTRSNDLGRVFFEATWSTGKTFSAAQPGSVEFFLVERYCLYSLKDGILYRSRIHHEPWCLGSAELLRYKSTMVESASLPTPTSTPLVYSTAPVHVGIWLPEKL
jgi:uncharacterized protein YqjF (DUF2071 family)